MIMVIIIIKKKMFKNVGGNIPGGDFLGGNFTGKSSGRNSMGGNFSAKTFPGEGVFLIR